MATLQKTYIQGNTYPVKDKLKALGCRWDNAQRAWWTDSDEVAAKAKALLGVQQPLNSPPPQDLGPVDAKAEAAKHGRVALTDSTVQFRRETSKGGDETGETFWGKHGGKRDRYLVVRSSRAQYWSRDWLEDMDMFTTDPGYYCSCDCVAVEPTADEVANDPVVAKAKAAALAKRRSEIEKAVRKVDTHKYDSGNTAGMVKCWGDSRMAGHEALWSDGVSRLVYERSDYDMGPSSWELVDAALAAEAVAIKDGGAK